MRPAAVKVALCGLEFGVLRSDDGLSLCQYLGSERRLLRAGRDRVLLAVSEVYDLVEEVVVVLLRLENAQATSVNTRKAIGETSERTSSQ